jgi:hypothetical protein
MPLIAAIDSRETDKPGKLEGEIICVKLDDSPWGEREEEQFTMIRYKDDELEQKLILMRAQGENHPVLVHPYAVYEEQDRGDGQMETVMTKRSRYVFQRRGVPDDVIARTGLSREKALDRTTKCPPLQRGNNPNAHYQKAHLTDTGV